MKRRWKTGVGREEGREGNASTLDVSTHTNTHMHAHRDTHTTDKKMPIYIFTNFLLIDQLFNLREQHPFTHDSDLAITDSLPLTHYRLHQLLPKMGQVPCLPAVLALPWLQSKFGAQLLPIPWQRCISSKLDLCSASSVVTAQQVSSG